MNDKNQTKLQKEIVDYLLNNGFVRGECGEEFADFSLKPSYWASRPKTPINEDRLCGGKLDITVQSFDAEIYVSMSRWYKDANPYESYILQVIETETGDDVFDVIVCCEMEAVERDLLLEKFILTAAAYAKLSSAKHEICDLP